MRFWLIALVALIFGGYGPMASAQAVVQSGPVTAFHSASFFGNGVVGDAGTPSSPFLSKWSQLPARRVERDGTGRHHDAL
jgi:hypothetical protein